MTKVTVAATQMACSWDLPKNIENAEKLVRQAHAKGAQIILIQELFAAPYFCIDQSPEHYALAKRWKPARSSNTSPHWLRSLRWYCR